MSLDLGEMRNFLINWILLVNVKYLDFKKFPQKIQTDI